VLASIKKEMASSAQHQAILSVTRENTWKLVELL